MIIRQEYLDRIQPFIGKPVIKAVTGLRRVGKSVFIRQIINQLKQNGIAEKNIVYVDIESLEFDFIRTYQDLNRYVLEQTAQFEVKILFFFLKGVCYNKRVKSSGCKARRVLWDGKGK
jgi:predicted AAA+ superfamily ATPase